MCCRVWPLLACLLLLPACGPPQSRLPATSWQQRVDGPRVEYRLAAELNLPDGLRIALNQGLQLRFLFSARRYRQGNWYRQQTARWQQSQAVRYSALTGHYRLQYAQGWRTLAEWREVVRELGRQQWRWPVAAGQQRVEVRWRLDMASLPPSLRLQALRDPSLRFDTGWQVLHEP